MRSKRELFRGSLLCVILDSHMLRSGSAIDAAKKAMHAGADMIQLRDKGASVKEMVRIGAALKIVTKRYSVPLIINDRLDVAAAVDSDGVHIGQGDVGVKTVRKILGPEKIIGVSVTSIDQGIRAIRDGADYLGIGPVFTTPIKASRKPLGLKLLEKARDLGLPMIAIGGIDNVNINKLAESGFKCVAVIRAVCGSTDVFKATKRLKEAIA